MAKVLVLYYSSYGHIERLAQAEAVGARSAGAKVDIKRVPELVPNKVALASHYKVDQIAPVARIDDLVEYDAVIFGTPTRFGNMAAQMKNFIDQAGAPMGAGQADRKGGFGVHRDRKPTWRPRSDNSVVSHRAPASRIHRCRPALFV
jgi:NAD(P)H dehydrogenase (quinone)